MVQLTGFLLHPPLSEIGKKIGKMSKYSLHFQSAFGTAACKGFTYARGCRTILRPPKWTKMCFHLYFEFN